MLTSSHWGGSGGLVDGALQPQPAAASIDASARRAGLRLLDRRLACTARRGVHPQESSTTPGAGVRPVR
jgi:hypothetical protein